MTVLVTGANGLIGSALVPSLKRRYPNVNIIASDVSSLKRRGGYVSLDVTQKGAVKKLVEEEKVTTIYHLAGLLSAGSEKNPQLGWQVNLLGLKNVLDVAVQHRVRVFWPSSIAIFGPTSPKVDTPQHTIIEPITMYGLAKYAGELLCQYYHHKLALDVRSIRYPGIISPSQNPGDGTTEYAIWMFHYALKKSLFSCYLRADTRLPMMYIEDAIRATIELMEAESSNLSVRTAYNLAAVSFTPSELYQQITKALDFPIEYKPDIRQATADSWPESIDDSIARKDWGWRPIFDLPKMTTKMIQELSLYFAI